MISLASPGNKAIPASGGFIAPPYHIDRTLDVQRVTGFVIAFGRKFLGRVIFIDREQAKAAAVGQSRTSWDDLAAEGWSVVPIRAEITRIDA